MYEKPEVDSMNPSGSSTLGTETWFEMCNAVLGANLVAGVTAVGAYELVFYTFAVVVPLSEQGGQSEP